MRLINRTKSTEPAMIIEGAVESDRRYFDERPDEEEYLREFAPGEFGQADLPEIPDGFRFATHVSVTLRVGGEPVARYRRLMAVCYDPSGNSIDAVLRRMR